METGYNHSYIHDQAKPERSSTDDGYLKPRRGNHQNCPDNEYLELERVNNQDIDISVQINNIDFEINEDNRNDMQRQQRSEIFEISNVAEYAENGNRTFIVIIILLVVLLVAIAATFGVLLANKDESSVGGTERTTFSTSLAITTTPPPPTTSAVGGTERTTFSTSLAITTTPPPPTTSEAPSIEEICLSKDGLIPHPSECQAFYNCDRTTRTGLWASCYGQYLDECPYPQLFSTETMTCEHFENVDCGDRKEAKDGCDYRSSEISCLIGPRTPCILLYPRCSGKDDGINMHVDKPWSPYYIICYKERFVTEKSCPRDPVSRQSQRFSPEYNACVTTDWIPKQYGGDKPNCKGKKDGMHMHDDRPWSPYYIICLKEILVTIASCPYDPMALFSRQLFSPEYSGCVSLERIPKEHGGYKQNCEGKEDGRHPNDYGRCNTYTICNFGQYIGYGSCENGTAFDEITKTCNSNPYLCECANQC